MNIYRGSLISVRIAVSSVYRYLRRRIAAALETQEFYIIDGNITDAEFERLKSYLINPVESREASLDAVRTLDANYEIPEKVEILENFIRLNDKGLNAFIKEFGLAMDFDDIKFCQSYFRDTEKRDPTITEIRMIDTYWSDHCRHTTFSTNIENVKIATPYIREAYDEYIEVRNELAAGKSRLLLWILLLLPQKSLKRTESSRIWTKARK